MNWGGDSARALLSAIPDPGSVSDQVERLVSGEVLDPFGSRAFAVADHHRHDADAAPACVDCHMPSRDYMVIDGRRDHSFRVPRPDLAASLGVTDACAACHDDRPDGWSATVVREWLGRDASGYQQFAEVFRAAERGEADAGQRLAALISAGDLSPIAHGTALGHLAAYPTRARIDLLVTSLALTVRSRIRKRVTAEYMLFLYDAEGRGVERTPFFHVWELRGVYPRLLDDPKQGNTARELHEAALLVALVRG